jgi:hypothetical protein
MTLVSDSLETTGRLRNTIEPGVRGEETKMKAITLAAALLTAAVLLTTASPASATSTSRVNALICAEAGGQATIPAGTEVEVALGVLVRNLGLATDFIHMQRTTIAINGGSPLDISSLWSRPQLITLDPYGSIWLTRVVDDTGVVLAQGETMHFQFVLDEPHLYLDLLTFENGVGGQPVLFFPNTYVYDCTVTGV